MSEIVQMYSLVVAAVAAAGKSVAHKWKWHWSFEEM